MPDIVLDVLPVLLNFTDRSNYSQGTDEVLCVVVGVVGGAGLSFTCSKLYCY